MGDEASGTSESLSISNDKGRLSESQIERMLRDAEKYAEEDRQVKERLDALDALKSYMKSMRDSVEGPLKSKLDSEDQEVVLTALNDCRDWLQTNHEVDAEELREKQLEVENVCAPIVAKVYGASGDHGSREDGDDESNE